MKQVGILAMLVVTCVSACSFQGKPIPSEGEGVGGGNTDNGGGGGSTDNGDARAEVGAGTGDAAREDTVDGPKGPNADASDDGALDASVGHEDAGVDGNAVGDGGPGSCGALDGRAANTTTDPYDCTDNSPCPLGLLCGGLNCDSEWTCFSHDDTLQHLCPTDMVPYCGCDGVTIYLIDTCPDRPYEHIGACDDGVNCDSGDLLCSLTEPSCPDGMVPSVVLGSYGPCVPISTCRCELVFDCPDRPKYSCDQQARRCIVTPDAGTVGKGDAGADAHADAGRVSGVDPSKSIDQLTPDERKTVCDFEASFYGGYGKQIGCGEGLALDGPASQADCVAAWPNTCPIPVSQQEQCSNERSCNLSSPVSCEALLACH